MTALRMLALVALLTPLVGGHGFPVASAASIPNDPLFETYQWNLRQIGAPEAWDITTGSASVTIAVLDTGVSQTHPDLSARLLPGFDFVNNDATPDDDHGNGTHVAGIAAAIGNNGIGVAGIAWQARILPVKVLDSAARGDPALVAQGVIWAVDRGAQIINLGLAGPTPTPALDAAIDYALGRGVLVVAPVGNNGGVEPSYPAATSGVLAVGATDRIGRRLPSSNLGDYIGVAAPGELIASTFKPPGGVDGYAVASTTAQAAAHVSGLAALMLSINPALRGAEMRALIEASADDVGEPGRDRETGFGRINVSRAVAYAAPWNFFSQGAGSYVAENTPATALFFPLFMKAANGWNTSMTVQNAIERSTVLTVDFVDEQGTTVHSFSEALPGIGSTTFDAPRIGALPAGFVGAAVVRSDTPIAGTVNEDREGRDRLTYEGIRSGSTTVWAPLLMRQAGAGEWSTGLQVQSLGAAPTVVRVTYFTRDAAQPLAASTFSLAPLASRSLYQPADERIPPGWVGSAVLESIDDQPLAAIVNQVNPAGPGMSYVGIGRTSPSLFAPLLFKNRGGWNTGLQVQNAGSVATGIDVVYSSSEGENGPWAESLRAAPGASATFYQPANPDLPDEFLGAATVVSSPRQPLGAIVNEVRYASRMAAAYNALLEGDDFAFAPLLYRGFAGWNSGIQVQNLGAAATTVSVRIYGQNGVLVARAVDSIGGHSSRTYYLPAIPAIPSGFVGSAIVNSASEPIAAIVNHVK